MPQLVPFYFINEITFGFVILTIIIYIFSKYFRPKFVGRTFIIKFYFINKITFGLDRNLSISRSYIYN